MSAALTHSGPRIVIRNGVIAVRVRYGRTVDLFSNVQMWLGPGSSNDITIGKYIDP